MDINHLLQILTTSVIPLQVNIQQLPQGAIQVRSCVALKQICCQIWFPLIEWNIIWTFHPTMVLRELGCFLEVSGAFLCFCNFLVLVLGQFRSVQQSVTVILCQHCSSSLNWYSCQANFQLFWVSLCDSGLCKVDGS